MAVADDEILTQLECHAASYERAELESLPQLQDSLSLLLLRTVEADNRIVLGHAMAVERLLSLIPALSAFSLSLRMSYGSLERQFPYIHQDITNNHEESAVQPVLFLLRIIRNLCAGVRYNKECFRLSCGHDAIALLTDGLINSCSDSEAQAVPFISENKTTEAGRLSSTLLLRKKKQPLSLSCDPIRASYSQQSPLTPVKDPNNTSCTQYQPRGTLQRFSTVHAPEIVDLLRTAVQIMSNFVVGDAENQEAVWNRWFPGNFTRLVKVDSSRVFEPLCTLLHICCQNNVSHGFDLCRTPEGISIVKSIIAKLNSDCTEPLDSAQFIIVNLFINSPHLPGTFLDLGDLSESYSGDQAMLLAALDAAMSTNQQISKNASAVFSFLIETVRKVALVAAMESNLEESSPSLKILAHALSICRHLSSTVQITDQDSIQGVRLLLDLLQALPLPSAKAPATPIKGPYPGHDPYVGYRKDLLSVIGNLAFRRKSVQDAVRENGGLLLVLGQCVQDVENPIQREWGIFAVRNLLEGSEENQREVEELRVLGGAESKELTLAGLRVEVNSESGRPKLVNVGVGEGKSTVG